MSAKMLNISDDLKLPLSAVTATTVVYGGKGMGKTNFGAVLVEEFTRAGLRWSVLDPMGVWWGMRYSVDGRSPGVECLILGGAHGDLPIEPTGGAVVADLVADENVSVIIDISRKGNGEMWSIGERIRFAGDYGKQLFRRQGSLIDGKRREPICQVIDEAARYIPQMIRSGDIDAAKCAGTWSAIVEEGRNVGLGVVLLTQRSARLNKDVAELADLMLAFRTVGPNSIEAVIDWLGAHIPKDKMKTMIEAVRSLPVGSCLAVSPGWLNAEKVIAIRYRQTFDSSATPKPGQQAVRVKGDGAKPDLSVYAARMEETIERAKADDPKALKQRIAELERSAARTAKVTTEVVAGLTEEEKETIAMLKEKLDALGAEIESIETRVGRMKAKLATARSVAEKLVETLSEDDADAVVGPFVETIRRETREMTPRLERLAARASVAARPQSAGANGAGATPVERVRVEGSPAQRILGALAQFRGIGVAAPEKMHVCLFSGYSNMASKGFANAMSSLSTAGLVSYPQPGKVTLTEAGVREAPKLDPIRGDDDLQARIFGMLSGPEQKILRPLIQRYPAAVDKEWLMAEAGYTNAASKGFANSLSRLSSLGFVSHRRGEARATEQCFLPR